MNASVSKAGLFVFVFAIVFCVIRNDTVSYTHLDVYKRQMHNMGRSFGDEDQGSDFRTKYEITSAIPVTLPFPVY